MKILTLIPLQKTTFTEELTYFSTQEIALGSIVTITIRNKKILGLVIGSTDASEAKSEIKNMDFNLKKIIDVKDISIFKKEFLESVLQTSKYFILNKSTLISYLIPSVLKENYDTISQAYKKNDQSIATEKNSNLNIKTEKLLYQASFDDRISYYKTLIRESFANKKSIFIVLPTERDIENFEEYFKKGIENFTFAIHSGLKGKKIINIIGNAVSCNHPVLIIATAPFLSIPRNDIQTIILENESSSMYRTMANPQFDLRTFVEIFASNTGSRLILGDTLLRFETLGRLDTISTIELRPASFRVAFEGEIEILEKNKKNFLGEEKFKVISDTSIEVINKSLQKNKNIFVFSLRKGLATFTVCKNCGTEVSCENCLSPVVLYKSRDGKKRMFVCNKCKTNFDPTMTCTHCGSWDLIPLGIGTDTIYEEIHKNVNPEYKEKIFKLDKEIAKSSKDAEKIIGEFEKNRGAVLVGTEMALFYLKNKPSISIIASFDSLWSIPNFKMSEKILQIILKILNKTENQLIIETKNTEDEAIQSIKNGNFMSYVRSELEDRKNLGYPPYKRFIKISYTGEKEETAQVKKYLSDFFKDYDCTIFGGSSEKFKEKYTTNLLIKINPDIWSINNLQEGKNLDLELSKKLTSLQNIFKISIDPEDLL